MQDSWRPCGDRGLLLASAASVQQRNTATYAHHGRGGQVSTYVPGCTIDRDQDRADSLHPDGLMRAGCPLRARRQSLRRSVAVIHRQGRTTLDLQIQWSDRHDKASSQAGSAGRFPSPARRYNRRSGGLSVRPGQSRVTSYRPGH